jgi:hypothetical protein
MTDYPPILTPLLNLVPSFLSDRWPDYVKEFGLGEQHIPDLIRMATDLNLHNASDDTPLIWAPMHALRALGQLRASPAVVPLLRFCNEVAPYESDFLLDDFGKVLGLIGEDALQPVLSSIKNPATHEWVRDDLALALTEIGKNHPHIRSACVQALIELLEEGRHTNPECNAWVVAALLDLKAVEAAPVIEKAFAESAVAEEIVGSWDHVAYDLGLRAEPPPARRFVDFGHLGPGLDPFIGTPSEMRPTLKSKARAKAKRKQAKASRKRNRKRR